MNKLILLLCFFTAIVVTSSCDSDDSTPALCNSWVLVSYVNETGEVMKEAEGYYYFMNFQHDGTFSGKMYGNDMSGEYNCKGNEIQINNLFVTSLSVEGTDTDKFFRAHLNDVNSYSITDSELRLYFSKDYYFKFRINNDNP